MKIAVLMDAPLRATLLSEKTMARLAEWGEGAVNETDKAEKETVKQIIAGAEPDVLPAAEEDAPPPQAVSAETASARERIKASAFFISDLLMKHYFRTGRTTGQPGPYMESIPGVHTGLF